MPSKHSNPPTTSAEPTPNTPLLTPSPSPKSTQHEQSNNIKPNFLHSTLFPTFTHLTTGLLFGFSLEKAKVHLPPVILAQMKMHSFVMMQMFLTASVVGLVGVTVAERVGWFKRSPKQAVGVGVKWLGRFGGNLVGGWILGMGMTLSGSCPGTVLVQLGAGVHSAWVTIAGSMLGALTFGYIQSYISRHLLPGFCTTSKSGTLDCDFNTQLPPQQPSAKKVSKTQPQQKTDKKGLTQIQMTTLFSVLLIPFLSALSTFLPFQSDLQTHLPTLPTSSLPTWSLSPTIKAWNPILAGLGVGVAQIVYIAFAKKTLGMSTVYAYIASNILPTLDADMKKNAPFYVPFQGAHDTLILAMGAVGGSYLSSMISGTFGIQTTSIPVWGSFVGGVLLSFGSRIAGGCTSGHGISGIAQLAVSSLVTVAAMFGGGM
ncbi:hypothetical protein HDV05_002141, partial [Chytridiales sp. JEL 0842]